MRWLPVVGFEGRYEVSDEGQVRGLRRGRLLSPAFVRGYPSVNLSAGSLRKARKVHQLVLEAFVGPRPPGAQARHFPDRDTNNNRLENLSWATPLANQRDRDVHGTHNRRGVKVSDDMVREIHATKAWPRGALIAMARQCGVSSTHIRRLINRQSREYVK